MHSPDYSEKDFRQAAAWVLRRLRKKRGVSQEQVAEAIGRNRQYLTKLEGGYYTPGPYLLAQFADYYSMQEGELMDRIVERARYYAKRHR